MSVRRLLPVAALASLLGACAAPGYQAPDSTVMAALRSSEVGQWLDAEDLRIIDRVTRDSLEFAYNGGADRWRNANSGHRGTVMPINVTYRADGTPCRELEQTAQVGGASVRARGRACRNGSSVWQVVDSWLLPPQWHEPQPPGASPPPYQPGPGPAPKPPSPPPYQPPQAKPGQPGNWVPLGDALRPGGKRREDW